MVIRCRMFFSDTRLLSPTELAALCSAHLLCLTSHEVADARQRVRMLSDTRCYLTT